MKKRGTTIGLRQDSRGVVSVMITMVMLIVITLIVIGFTQIANRNRQESLDRQLSSQAFYAAESGINFTVDKLKDQKKNGVKMDKQTDCGTGAGATYPVTQLSAAPDVRVTCVLVDPAPDHIETTVSTTYATTVLIDAAKQNGTPSNLQNLTFDWAPAGGLAPDVSGCETMVGRWQPNYANCNTGVLKVDLTQLPGGGGPINPATLASNTKTFYLRSMQPGSFTAAPTINSFSAGPRSYTVGGNCVAASGLCSSQINLTGSAQTKRYFARLTMYYKESGKVSIDGQDNSGSAKDAYFEGAQVVVDSTGRAQDVLRRVQTRLSLNIEKDTSLPTGALGSGATICKRFTVTGDSVIPDGGPECNP